MRNEEIKKIVGEFKEKNDISYRITDRLVEYFDELEEKGYTYNELLLIVRSVSSDSIYDILNPSFIDFFKSSRREMESLNETIIEKENKIEEQKKFDIEEQQSNISIGILEKAMARVMLDEYAPQLAERVMADAKELIQEEYGTITKKIVYEIPETGRQLKEVTHEEFETVLNFVMADESVMLIGPAGTGKNVICKQVAELLGLDFYFSNAVTQEYKLTGFIDANGYFHETPFYKAFTQGGVFMLDEIDASIPEVLVILNAAIANRYFDFPNGMVEAHEDFKIIAAGNTFGTGASYTYTGRNQLDGASLDRFAQVHINYSEKIEESLTDDKDLINFIRTFRKACERHGINHIVSYRSIKRLDKMANVINHEKALSTCLLKNLEKDDLRMMCEDFTQDSVWERGFRVCAE